MHEPQHTAEQAAERAAVLHIEGCGTIWLLRPRIHGHCRTITGAFVGLQSNNACLENPVSCPVGSLSKSAGSTERPALCREARTKLSRRPWRVDTFDELALKWFSVSEAASLPDDGVPNSPFRRVIMFVDNAGKPAACEEDAQPQRAHLPQGLLCDLYA